MSRYISKEYFNDVHRTSQPYLAFKVGMQALVHAFRHCRVCMQNCSCLLQALQQLYIQTSPEACCACLRLVRLPCCVQEQQASWRADHAVEVSGQSYFETAVGHMTRPDAA